MSQTLINLVASGGLVAIFVTMTAESAGIPISSEIVVPLGGALASQGRLSFVLVVAAASFGNLVGSLIAFYITRRWGMRFILSRTGRLLGLSQGHLRLANRVFGRFGIWAVFFGRLLPVVRTYISFPAGLTNMRVEIFTIATLLGAIPWNFGLAFAGYTLGQKYAAVATALGPFAIPMAIVVVALLIAGWWYGRKLGSDETVEPQTTVA